VLPPTCSPALILDLAGALQETFRRLLPVCENLIVQELVPGDDLVVGVTPRWLDELVRVPANAGGPRAWKADAWRRQLG
jgi:hypothetical protein